MLTPLLVIRGRILATIPTVNGVIIPVLRMRKLRLITVKQRAQGHRQWADLELNPSLFDTKAQAFDHSAEVLMRMGYSC